MRKKKDKCEGPEFSKDNKSYKSKSKGQHSILRRHEEKLDEYKKIDIKLNKINKELIHCKENLIKLNECKDKEKKDLALETSELSKKINSLELEKEKLNNNSQDEINYLLESSELVMKISQLEQKEISLLNNDAGNEDLNNLIDEKNLLIEEYLLKFEKNYVSIKNIYIKHSEFCLGCNEHMLFQSGYLVCQSCGFCKNAIETNGELSYKELQDYDYRPQFTYDKMTHLEDWLRRFQAKENRVIPQEILDKVILEANKERIKDLNLLTEDKVKKYLKKLNLNEYYDNVIAIINRINTRPPFTLTSEIEEKIKTMFQQIQEPYEKHKPKSRKNFLSYSYVLHKIFQILGLYEFSKYFPLLKSSDKLRQQDEIFKKIVQEMAKKDHSVKWVFYPSL